MLLIGTVQRSKSVRKHFGGGNALEVGDLRLVENGSERGGALGADVVASETASKEYRMGTVRE